VLEPGVGLAPQRRRTGHEPLPPAYVAPRPSRAPRRRWPTCATAGRSTSTQTHGCAPRPPRSRPGLCAPPGASRATDPTQARHGWATGPPFSTIT